MLAKMQQLARIGALLAAAGFTASVWAFPPAHSGLAKGVKVVAPAKPVANEKQCLACHSTVAKLHNRGAHKKHNCGLCHTVPKDHATAPSAKNRPATNTGLAACSQCHKTQMNELADTKYHMKWAAEHEQQTHSWISDSTGSEKDTNFRVPRFHVGLLADVAVNRMGGRFAYKNKADEGRPVINLWEKVYDTKPEMGEDLKLMKPSLAWRPQKHVGLANLAVCLRCKSADDMLDWAYLGEPGKAPMARDSKSIKSIKHLNNGTNCIYCHDPHSAEPRVTIDYFMPALIDPQYKDNEFQKRTGKSLAKVEVIEMGVRGYKRKIGILDRYDSNLMCGQCHQSYHGVTTMYNAKGEKLPGMKFPNFATTIYSDGPLAAYGWYEKRGLWMKVDAATGVKYPQVPTHGHVETVSISKHGLAGVGCTDCHFAKKKDGTAEHNPSLPNYKIASTCLNSKCHGQGTKFNWKSVNEAKYEINLIQQRARNRMNHWQQAHSQVRDYLVDVKQGRRMTGENELKALKRAYGRSLCALSWWTTDYSDGVHNPDMQERDAIAILGELNKALGAARKAEGMVKTAAK